MHVKPVSDRAGEWARSRAYRDDPRRGTRIPQRDSDPATRDSVGEEQGRVLRGIPRGAPPRVRRRHATARLPRACRVLHSRAQLPLAPPPRRNACGSTSRRGKGSGRVLVTTDFIFSVNFTHFFSNRMYIFSSVRKFSVTSYWFWTVTGACRHDHICSVLFWRITAVARLKHARRTCSVEHVTVQSPAGAGPR